MDEEDAQYYGGDESEIDSIKNILGFETSAYLDEWALIHDVSREEALRLIVEDYTSELTISGVDVELIKEPPRPTSGLTKGVFIGGMFLFMGIAAFGISVFFRWLSKLRIPEEAWMDFSPSGSEHFMFVSSIFPGLVIGALVIGWLMKLFPYFRRNLEAEERKPGRFPGGCMFISFLIPLLVALYGSDSYGWAGVDGIHYNPLFGIGETKHYRWDQIAHVHTEFLAGKSGDRRISYRVIFYDGNNVDLMEGWGNRFIEVAPKIEQKIKTISSIDVSQTRLSKS